MKHNTASLAEYLDELTTYLNAAEVSDLIGVTKDTVYRWAQEGVLPSATLVNRLRFDPKQLATWVCEHQYVALRGVAHQITAWAHKNLVGRSAPDRLPVPLTKALNALDYDWLAKAAQADLNSARPNRAWHLADDLQSAIETLPYEEQRGLLADLRSGQYDHSEELLVSRPGDYVSFDSALGIGVGPAEWAC